MLKDFTRYSPSAILSRIGRIRYEAKSEGQKLNSGHWQREMWFNWSILERSELTIQGRGSYHAQLAFRSSALSHSACSALFEAYWANPRKHLASTFSFFFAFRSGPCSEVAAAFKWFPTFLRTLGCLFLRLGRTRHRSTRQHGWQSWIPEWTPHFDFDGSSPSF